MNWIMTLLAVIAGISIGTQAGINGGLGKKIGVIEGAFVSFAIGTLILLVCTIFLGKGNLLNVFSVPKWQLTGGLLGAIYVLVMVLAVPKIGVATTIVSVILGQVLISGVIDHFGLFGGKQIPFDWQRGVAALLLGISLYLMYKK